MGGGGSNDMACNDKFKFCPIDALESAYTACSKSLGAGVLGGKRPAVYGACDDHMPPAARACDARW